MIAAAIVIPPIVARLLTDSFKTMALLSTGIGAFCGWGGVYLSYFVDVSSGASVVLFSALLFGVALLYSNLRGLVAWPPGRVDGRRRGAPNHSDAFD